MKDPQSDARIRDLEQRMAAMPGSRIFVGLAEEYRRAGRFADALAILRNGLEAHPTYLSARIAIARLYQETGRVEEALEAFSKVLASDRENLVAAKALGDLYGRQGNAVEAVKKFKLYRALSGDRSVDERIAALEREMKAEGPGLAAPAALDAHPPMSSAMAPPPAPAPAPAPAMAPAPAPAIPPAGSPASRLFDPMNYADTSGAFELGPNATLALSTLDFAAAEEPELAIPSPMTSETSSEVPVSLEDEELENSDPAAPPSPVEASPAALVEESQTTASEELVAELDAAEELPAEESKPAEEVPVPYALPAEEVPGADDIPTADELPEAEEISATDEFPSEPGEGPSEMPDLPPSRTLAELYERQGFPEEARQIYDRLDAAPSDRGSPSEPGRFAPPADAPGGESADPRSRKRRAIEAWLSRVKTNASAGAR